MITYVAYEPRTDGQTYQFRSLDALARRLGGDAWHVVHDPADGNPVQTIEITRYQPAVNAHSIVATLRVPAEAISASAEVVE